MLGLSCEQRGRGSSLELLGDAIAESGRSGIVDWHGDWSGSHEAGLVGAGKTEAETNWGGGNSWGSHDGWGSVRGNSWSSIGSDSWGGIGGNWSGHGDWSWSSNSKRGGHHSWTSSHTSSKQSALGGTDATSDEGLDLFADWLDSLKTID